MRWPRPIVFGNWKMHGLRAEARALADALAAYPGRRTATLGVFPPFTVLGEVAAQLEGSGIVVGGQDCHGEAKGAFTGSISAPMLKDVGATAVLVGHSERRHGLGEPDALIRAKAMAGLACGLLVVLCIGETEDERVAGKTLEVLDRQDADFVVWDASEPLAQLLATSDEWAVVYVDEGQVVACRRGASCDELTGA